MPKTKPNKGLLKRIRLTKNGRVKLGRAGGRHMRSHKSAKLRGGYRKNNYASSSDTRRICSMLFISAGKAKDRAPKTAETATES